jgi:hypothetical protein
MRVSIVLLVIAIPYLGTSQMKSFIKRYEQELGSPGYSGGMFTKQFIKVSAVRITDMSSGGVLKYIEISTIAHQIATSEEYYIKIECDNIDSTLSAITVMKDDITKDLKSWYKYYITDHDYLFMRQKDMKYEWGIVFEHKLPYTRVSMDGKYLKDFTDMLIKGKNFCNTD